MTDFTDPVEELARPSRCYNAPTEDELKALGVMYATGTGMREAVGTTYLRIVVRTMQNLDGSICLHPPSEHITAAGFLARPIAAAITAGMGLDGMHPLERNRRTNFLRTQIAQLYRYFEAGGTPHDLDPMTVTKQILKEGADALRAAPGTVGPPPNIIPEFPIEAPSATAVAARHAFRRLTRVLGRCPSSEQQDLAIQFVKQLTEGFLP